MASPKVFVREATGLVREWSTLDGLMYDILAITIPTAFALIFSLVPFVFLGADVVAATIFGMIVFLPVGVTYAMMAATMPRSGGDYVFQSRGLHPAIGFMTGFAFIFVIDALFVAVNGVVLSSAVVSPLLAIAGSTMQNQSFLNAAAWFAASTGAFLVAVIVILFCGAINFGGMRLYARTQKVAFIIGLIGALATIAVFASYNNSQFVTAFNSFASAYTSDPDAYHTIIRAANESGFAANQPVSLQASLMAVTIVAFGFTGIIWSVQTAGEIKKAGTLKTQLIQIIGALVFGGVLLSILAFFVTQTVGSPFLAAAGYLFFTGNSAYPIPIAPYFYLFAFVLNSNGAVVLFIFLWYVLWLLYANTNGPLGGTRFLLAAAFDRVLPSKFGDVSDRFHIPAFSVIAFVVLALILAALYAFVPIVGTFTLDLIFGLLIMQICTCLAAVVLPYKNKEIYELSTITKYKVGGIPLLSIAGAISVVLLLWLAYLYATVGALGVNSPPSAAFLVAVFASGLIIYYIAKVYRKRQGLDLDLVFKQIPPE